jgi:hypothetical protein
MRELELGTGRTFMDYQDNTANAQVQGSMMEDTGTMADYVVLQITGVSCG